MRIPMSWTVFAACGLLSLGLTLGGCAQKEGEPEVATEPVVEAAGKEVEVSEMPAAETPGKPLFERLGGEYAIATVVDSFIDLLLVNDVLNANPEIKKARDRVPKAGLKFQVTALVCEATGGPCKYTGRTMKDSHAHLNISEREWQAMLSDFRRVLNNYQVPPGEQKELFAIVESTKKDIITSGG
jgi:hemoglobin